MGSSCTMKVQELQEAFPFFTAELCSAPSKELVPRTSFPLTQLEAPAPREDVQRVTIERVSNSTSLVDVLDRVLDKGIVIDAWIRVFLVGIDLVSVEARVVVASFETYLKYSDALAQSTTVSRGGCRKLETPEDVLAENARLRQEVTARARRRRAVQRRGPEPRGE